MGQEVSSKLVRYIHYCSTGTFNPQVEDDDDDDDEYHHVSADPRLSLTSTTAPGGPQSQLAGEAGAPGAPTDDDDEGPAAADKSDLALSTSHIDVANESEDHVLNPAALNHSLGEDHRTIVSS